MNQMSIVDPSGKNVQSDQREPVDYKVGEVSLTTNGLPIEKLNEALAGARQVAAMQLMGAAKQQAAQSGIHIPDESLKIQAIAEASKILDPFKMEPCAQAVFMMLAEEIVSKNETIEALIDRVEKLECASSNPNEGSSSKAGRPN